MGLNREYSKDQWGFRAKDQSAWKVTERGDIQAKGHHVQLAGS